MKPEFLNRQFLFLHVPKTAGTSFRVVLVQQFPPNVVFPTEDMFTERGGYIPTPETLGIPQHEFDKYRLVCGHYCYRNIVEKFSRPPVLVTMLRDPLARCISECKHIIRHKDHDMRQHVHIENPTIQDIINCPEICDYFQELLRRIFLHDLPDAKALLNRSGFLGIQERFADSIALLSRTFGLRCEQIPRANRAPENQRNDEISSEDKERLRRLLSWDYELYNYACELFERRLNALSVPVIAESA